MKEIQDGAVLKIFLGEADTHQGKPVYELIVLKAREMGLAGATVTKGIMGFGKTSEVHTSKVLRMSEDMPVTIEIVDSKASLEKLLPYLEEVMTQGFVILDKADSVRGPE